MSSERASDVTLTLRLFRQGRRYLPHVVGIMLLDVLSTPLALLVPVPLKIVVDSVLDSDPLPGFLTPFVPASVASSSGRILVFAVLLVVIIAALKQIQGLAGGILKTFTGEKLALDFRSRLFRHAQRLSLTYHDSAGSADAIYRIQYDSPAIHWVVVNGFPPLLTACLTLAGMIYVTARLDSKLALVALAVVPILAILTIASRGTVRRQWKQVKEIESQGLAVVQEVLSALRVVKAFGQEEREQGRFRQHYASGVLARIKVALTEGGFGLLVGLTTAAGSATILYLGTLHVQAGILTLGELLLILTYVAQLYSPLRSIVTKVTSLQSSLASAERAYVLLDQPRDVPDPPNGRRLQRAAGAIEFDAVDFAYEPEHPVLQGVDLQVPEGTRIGISGRTGEGKSTLVNLLTRFYDPVAGRILLDGIDLREYKLSDLRDQFAIVLQEPVLFSTSVAENIAYGRPDAAFEEIVEAARAANAHDFIMELSEGYDTAVGERGMRLSGGERQRVALARAFLKDAPILILDEPTSSVDVGTEASIVDAMRRLMAGRTTFLIAHRESTLQSCEVIVHLENGRIACPNGARVS